MPIWRAARWTIWSASPCRRCCGANCRARARRAACNRWRCAWWWSARPRSKPSRPRNIGASTPMSPPPSGDFAARLIQLDGKKLEKLSLAQRSRRQARRRRDRGADIHHRQRRGQAGQAQSLAAFHHLDPAAGSRAQAGLRRQAHHADRAGLYEGVDIGGETVGLITYMRTDGITMVPRSDRRGARRDRQEIRRPLCARTRRASIPARPRTRRKPMKRCAPPASRARRKRWRAISMPMRPGSTN